MIAVPHSIRPWLIVHGQNLVAVCIQYYLEHIADNSGLTVFLLPVRFVYFWS